MPQLCWMGKGIHTGHLPFPGWKCPAEGEGGVFLVGTNSGRNVQAVGCEWEIAGMELCDHPNVTSYTAMIPVCFF